MALMKLIYATSSKLDSLEQVDGQIIFVPDANIIALDMKNQRFIYKTIKTFSTEQERINDVSAIPGFYFVDETNTLWRLTNSRNWRQINSSVFYSDSEETLPSMGNIETLYYTDKGVYNWKPQLNEYNLIANANIWESI